MYKFAIGDDERDGSSVYDNYSSLLQRGEEKNILKQKKEQLFVSLVVSFLVF
jgi:hypothetical protein